MMLEYYAWLIPLFPLLAFMLIILAPGLKDNKAASSWVAIVGVMASWILSWAIFFLRGDHLVHEMEEGHAFHQAIAWMPTGNSIFEMSYILDGLALAMIFMVPFVVTMIFIYSMGYHNLGTPNVEPRYSRFFAYVSLFAAGMLTLAISGNMLLFFIAWEVMGLCSYLLIGFWYEKKDEGYKFRMIDGKWQEDRSKLDRLSPNWSSIKAFLTTRVGDVLFFAGLMWLYAASIEPSLNIYEVLTVENIEHLKELTWGIQGVFEFSVLPTIALLIFGGAVGKSAQFPLHVWLPDAMAGPTPVSAMIHAATMVAAGVFLVARMLPLFEPLHGSPALYAVALIGAFTAFFAATIAISQQDVKGVLAYSTISQLGYMIAALGLGGLVAGVFHMLTHAFFKALLFMSSGSVIHGMEHGIHHVAEHNSDGHGHGHDDHGHGHDEHAHAEHIDPQNMWNMGGLRKHMPATFWAFVIGGASLAGIPFITAGFWSKDEILGEAYHLWQEGEMLGGTVPLIVLVLLTITAVLTAFYTGRQLGLTFFGKERTEEAQHAHESPLSMTLPLGILSIFAIIAGYFNLPAGFLPFLPEDALHRLGHLLEAVHEAANGEAYHALEFNWLLAGAVGGLGTLAFVGGIFMYRGRAVEPLRVLGPLWTAMENKWYVDEVYKWIFIKPAVATADFLRRVDADWIVDPIVNGAASLGRRFGGISNWLDRNIVDGTVNLLGIVMDEVSNYLKLLQTGRVQNYLVILLTGLLVLAGLYFR